MKFEELPAAVQDELKRKQSALHSRSVNTSYDICFYNERGTRYFKAHRNQRAWTDDRGNSMPFGGGSEWRIYFGAVQFHSQRDPFGGILWELCDGKRFTAKVVDGVKVAIPATLKTKKEVLQLAAALGF